MPEGIAMGKPITDDEVRGLFHLWNDALATLDPKAVATRYAKKGELMQHSITLQRDLTVSHKSCACFCRRSPPHR
jgi:hypothetical protein